MTEKRFSSSDLQEIWPLLSIPERIEGLRALIPRDMTDSFQNLSSQDQLEIILSLPTRSRKSWLQSLPPDDLADVLQLAPQEEKYALLSLLNEEMKKEVSALMAYAEDVAGGLMNPRYNRVRLEMTIGEAISYLRRQAREHMVNQSYGYVLDVDQHLLGVISFKDLFSATDETPVSDIMKSDIVTVSENMDQEGVSRTFSQYNFTSIPVVDHENKMKGIVTADDIVSVVQEEATEDIQKSAAMETLSAPYLRVSLWEMIRKRGSWLSFLFLGEMLTATAMGYFENEIAKAVVLALFIPLIISSGGNSGSQASTLIIRAMALGEVKLRDWWRVVRRELVSGLALGSCLGMIGLLRILLWPAREQLYGHHYPLVAITVALSLVGVVTFGTIAGSTLPFLLKRVRLDPASASAPFVATLVDVTGLVIYFVTAQLLLRGTLL